MSREFFITCAPGLEAVCADEVKALGLKVKGTEWGGVSAKGKLSDAMRLHLYARTPHRVTLRVGEVRALAFQELAYKVSTLPWGTWVRKDDPITVRASAHHSRLYHQGGIAQRVAEGIYVATRAVWREDADEESAQLVLARMEDDVCTLSLDMTGALLHRRGYRQETGRAPLRESIAASLLRWAGWTPREALVDPMCGSGTFPIEAAWIGLGRPAGASRGFAFERWPSLEVGVWGKLREEAQARIQDPNQEALTLVASDRSEDALQAAQHNAQRAEVSQRIAWRACDVGEVVLPEGGGLIVCNAPYGDRIGSVGSLMPVYARLGRLAAQPGWRLLLLSTEPSLRARCFSALGAPPVREIVFQHGGLSVTASLSGESGVV
jgi:putative N6-adenine-specific DNA methylase